MVTELVNQPTPIPPKIEAIMSSLTKTLLVATLIGASHILHLRKLKSIEVLKVDQLASHADLDRSLNQVDATALKPLVNRKDISVFANSTTRRGKLKNLITHVLVMNDEKDRISSATKLNASVEGIRETLSMVLEGGVTDQTTFDFDPNRLRSELLKRSRNWSDGTLPGQHRRSRDFGCHSTPRLRASAEGTRETLSMYFSDQLMCDMVLEGDATDQTNPDPGLTKLRSDSLDCPQDRSNGTLPGQQRCSRDFGCHSTLGLRASVEGSREILSLNLGDQLLRNMVPESCATDQTNSDSGQTKLRSDLLKGPRDWSNGTSPGQHQCLRDSSRDSVPTLRASVEGTRETLSLYLGDQLMKNRVPGGGANDQIISDSGLTKLWTNSLECSRDWSDGTLPGQHQCSRDSGCHSAPMLRASVEGTRETSRMYLGDQWLMNTVLQNAETGQTTFDSRLTKLWSDWFALTRNWSDRALLGQHRHSRAFGGHHFASFRHQAVISGYLRNSASLQRPIIRSATLKEQCEGDNPLESYKANNLWSSSEAPTLIRKHQNGRDRKGGKPDEAQVSKVAPKEDEDIDSIDLQY